MWGAIIGSAIGLGASVYGRRKAADDAKKMNRALDRKERDLDSYYNGELSESVMDTEYAKASMKKIREELDERAKQNESTSAIMGSSDEAKIAGKNAETKSISDAVSSLTLYDAQRKDALRRDYMDRKDSLFATKMGIYQNNQQSAMNLSNNGWNTIGSAIASYYGTKDDKKANGEKAKADSGSGGDYNYSII